MFHDSSNKILSSNLAWLHPTVFYCLTILCLLFYRQRTPDRIPHENGTPSWFEAVSDLRHRDGISNFIKCKFATFLY